MHFGRVNVGDHYSVSPEATLGPTQGAEKQAEKKRLQENESRKDFEQRSEQPRSD
jgi:hypothetical protein